MQVGCKGERRRTSGSRPRARGRGWAPPAGRRPAGAAAWSPPRPAAARTPPPPSAQRALRNWTERCYPHANFDEARTCACSGEIANEHASGVLRCISDFKTETLGSKRFVQCRVVNTSDSNMLGSSVLRRQSVRKCCMHSRLSLQALLLQAFILHFCLPL